MISRVMPKRPCAISLTSDDSSILCADKFGDVYFLPLLGQSRDHTVFDEATKNEPRQSDRAKQQSFGPSANSLTVHTKRNRDALRQQQKLSKPNAEKKALNFDHQLLLGHVSLLTDIASVTLASSSTRKQSYILTSDRDEHIRVSRGIPQAHIIEGYCLGHTEFVSKLCVIPTHSHLLISGGGDGYLLLWEWLSGTLKQKIDLKNTVEAARIEYGQRRTGTNPSLEDRNTGLGEDSAHTLSVSNIQILRHTKGMSEQPVNEIIVTCEGYVPA